MAVKKKKCKECKKEFNPMASLQVACSLACALKLNEKNKAKKWAKEKAEIKDRLKSHSEHLRELQVIFNTYIRLRDKGKPCISCGCDLTNKPTNASHYYSVNANPNLRFNENNVHSSCIKCNKELHGNLIEYGIRLPERIGYEAYNELRLTRSSVLKLSIPEICILKLKYKERIKMLKNDKD